MSDKTVLLLFPHTLYSVLEETYRKEVQYASELWRVICSERQAKLLILCFVKSYTCLLLMCTVIKRFILENDFCGPTRTHRRP